MLIAKASPNKKRRFSPLYFPPFPASCFSKSMPGLAREIPESFRKNPDLFS
jgi:hypothetical protein